MYEELHEQVSRRPFTPFRLHFTNGNTHDVTHPENLMLSEAVAAVSVGKSIWFVALEHVVEIEPLATIEA